jgi:hypothetical protein
MLGTMIAMKVALNLTTEFLWDGDEERRVGNRVDLLLQCRIDFAEFESTFGVVTNLSLKGFAFCGLKTIPVSSKLWIKLPHLDAKTGQRNLGRQFANRVQIYGTADSSRI